MTQPNTSIPVSRLWASMRSNTIANIDSRCRAHVPTAAVRSYLCPVRTKWNRATIQKMADLTPSGRSEDEPAATMRQLGAELSAALAFLYTSDSLPPQARQRLRSIEGRARRIYARLGAVGTDGVVTIISVPRSRMHEYFHDVLDLVLNYSSSEAISRIGTLLARAVGFLPKGERSRGRTQIHLVGLPPSGPGSD